MQRVAKRLGCVAVCAAVLGSFAVAPGAIAQDNPGHALADKFSRAAEDAERAEKAREAEAARKAVAEREAAEQRQRAAEAARKAHAEAERRRVEAERREYEAEMLRQARAEAEARRAAELKAQKEREERAKAQRLAREAEEKRRAEQARLEAEREAARAQAARLAREAAERRQAAARRAEEERKAEAARLAREVEEKRRAEAREAAEAERIKKQAELEAKRQQELADIAEKFRLAREARERAAREAEDRAQLAKRRELEQTRTSLGGPRPADTYDRAPERVTVLLIVEPRRRGKSPNPVLCVGKSCYVSAGAETDARRMSRSKTLGPGNTIGRRAGPCNKQRTCVYRNVYLGNVGSIQPVDMGFWGHKRHDIYSVRPDKSCSVKKGRLLCTSPVIGHGYRAWIVPESVAARAGVGALEASLQDGLPSARSAALDDDWGGSIFRQDR